MNLWMILVINERLAPICSLRFRDMLSSIAKEPPPSTAMRDKRSAVGVAPLDPQVYIYNTVLDHPLLYTLVLLHPPPMSSLNLAPLAALSSPRGVETVSLYEENWL